MVDIIKKDKKIFVYKMGDDTKERGGHEADYRGEQANYMPSRINLKEVDAVDKYILSGLVPSEKFIGKDDVLTTFGSCFARSIIEFVKSRGYKTGELYPKLKNIRDSHILYFAEGIVNTFSLLQQFEWAYEGKQFAQDIWFGKNKEAAPQTEEIRLMTKNILDYSTVFIITLGLSEIWYNKITGDACWRSVPFEKFDPNVYGFRVSTVEENKNNICSIVNIIRKHNPNATIVFTLSPVPLVATFRPVSCVSANTASKCILRAALDEALRTFDNDSKLFYWPSYEIVKDYFVDPYEDDNRHVKKEVINTITGLFEKYFLIPLKEEEKIKYV